METKWLEDFVSLAETRSFSRSALNYDAFVESAVPSYYRLRTDLSYPPADATPAALYSLVFLRLKIGKVDDLFSAPDGIRRAVSAGG